MGWGEDQSNQWERCRDHIIWRPTTPLEDTQPHLFCHRIGKRGNQTVSLSASSPSNINSNIDDADADLDDADADLDDDQIVLLPLKSAANKDNIQSPPPNPIPSQSSAFATPFYARLLIIYLPH